MVAVTPPPHRPLLLALMILLLSLLSAERARSATPSTSSLGWSRLSGAEDCISSRQLAGAVEALLGRQVFVSPALAEVQVEGHVERNDGGWLAALVVSDAAGQILGQRRLESTEPSCRSLDEPVTLAIALMIDPEAALAPPAPPQPTPSLPAPAAPPPPEQIVEERLVFVPAAPSEAADEGGSPADPWRLGVRAGPRLAVGLLPAVGFGLQAALQIEPPWLIPVEAGAAVYLPRSASLDGFSADFSLAYVTVAPCPRLRLADLALSACAEVQIGRLWADGQDADGDWQSHQLVANLAPKLRADYRLVGPLEVGVGLGAAIPLVRDSFRLHLRDGSDEELFRLPAAAAETDLAVGLRFP